MPYKDNVMKFKNIHHQLPVPFVFFADIECFIDSETNEHKMGQICYTVASFNVPNFTFKPRIFMSMDRFWQSIIKDAETLRDEYIRNPLDMEPLNEIQEHEFQIAGTCHICSQPFNVNEIRVRDHDHLTVRLLFFKFFD